MWVIWTCAHFKGQTMLVTRPWPPCSFLGNTDALIIDLRQNGGGSPQMIQLISSYLFGPEPVSFETLFYRRATEQYDQTWTLPHVDGKRNPDLPVYVLTSNRTFSAAEEFSYNLKTPGTCDLGGRNHRGWRPSWWPLDCH